MPTQVFLSFCYGASNVLSFVCFGVSSLATCSVIIPKRRWMPDLASFHNIESNFHISPSAIISTLIDRAWYHVWTETEMFRCQMNQMWCDQDISRIYKWNLFEKLFLQLHLWLQKMIYSSLKKRFHCQDIFDSIQLAILHITRVLDLKNWIKFKGNSNMYGSITDGLFKNAPEGEPSSQQTVLSLFRPQTWK